MTIPDYLAPTVELLRRAFPEGLDEPRYRAVLSLMAEHISARNFADAIALYSGRDYDRTYNDILGAYGVNIAPATLEAVRERLIACGFEAWKSE
jgi:hypothetical protein